MAVNEGDGAAPLYLYTINRILREMRMEQQKTGERFDYEVFKTRLACAELTAQQIAPLTQRLSVLESFMPARIPVLSKRGNTKGRRPGKGTDWTSKVSMGFTPVTGLLLTLSRGQGRISYYR